MNIVTIAGGTDKDFYFIYPDNPDYIRAAKLQLSEEGQQRLLNFLHCGLEDYKKVSNYTFKANFSSMHLIKKLMRFLGSTSKALGRWLQRGLEPTQRNNRRRKPKRFLQ